LPRPWEPECCPPKLRGEIWAWLDEVVDWLNTEYCWDPDGLIPACWPHHPHLVHELVVLADQRRLAGQAVTSDLLEEWHRYTLPSFHDRLRKRLRSHCDEGHQPWPATGRHLDRHLLYAGGPEPSHHLRQPLNVMGDVEPVDHLTAAADHTRHVCF
jgi:hypothetical protein